MYDPSSHRRAVVVAAAGHAHGQTGTVLVIVIAADRRIRDPAAVDDAFLLLPQRREHHVPPAEPLHRRWELGLAGEDGPGQLLVGMQLGPCLIVSLHTTQHTRGGPGRVEPRTIPECQLSFAGFVVHPDVGRVGEAARLEDVADLCGAGTQDESSEETCRTEIHID